MRHCIASAVGCEAFCRSFSGCVEFCCICSGCEACCNFSGCVMFCRICSVVRRSVASTVWWNVLSHLQCSETFCRIYSAVGRSVALAVMIGGCKDFCRSGYEFKTLCRNFSYFFIAHAVGVGRSVAASVCVRLSVATAWGVMHCIVCCKRMRLYYTSWLIARKLPPSHWNWGKLLQVISGVYLFRAKGFVLFSLRCSVRSKDILASTRISSTPTFCAPFSWHS